MLCVSWGVPQGTWCVAAEPDTTSSDRVSYWEQIRPILQERCQGCHQPAKQGGGYVMTDFERMRAGGESGDPAITPGKPGDSALVEQITPVDGEAAMPKDGKPLTAEQLELIRRWIEQGAEDDSPASTRARYDNDHPPTYDAPPVITSLDFSPDGHQLAVSGYHEVVLHDIDRDSGQHAFAPIARLVGLSERIESNRFSPDGKLLAVTGGSPGRLGELQVWDVERRSLVFSQAVTYDTIYGASWSPDGRLVAFGGPDHAVRAVEAATGKQVLFNGVHDDWVLDTVFSAQGDHVVSVSRDRSMKLLHVETQRFIDNITSITPGALKGGLNAVDRHPQRDELLCGGADGAPKLYRMVREQARKIGDDFNLIRAYPALEGRVYDVAFSRDGERIVAGSSLHGKGQVKVFQAADAAQLVSIDNPCAVYAVAFHPDGQRIAIGGFDGHIRIYQVSDGALLKDFIPVPLTADSH